VVRKRIFRLWGGLLVNGSEYSASRLEIKASMTCSGLDSLSAGGESLKEGRVDSKVWRQQNGIAYEQ
jgi:hypothetical protein